ncbi:hypothetical protein DFH08DRAFT_936749 [Mycena albidolilacea]|uniref:Uncharacterized protein n=1 Tax=Mycena albidolilacea TaxID=1033008 RepID=A0AAD7ESS9_9AGAR|nr:hypothetical protein DFH08DRAFT_936749 [Mycena albidolilacea]
MLPKFLACGLAALALVRATPFQVNIAVFFDTAVTAGIEAGNYCIVNIGRNETLSGVGKGQPAYTESTPGMPGPLAQWKVEPAVGSNEFKFFNIGLNSSTSTNNGQLYVSYGPGDLSLTHAVTPVQGKADTFTPEVLIQSTKITRILYGGAWTTYWDSYYKRTQV